jgi:DNA-binding winged helix-turn-helix (wHTH) protein
MAQHQADSGCIYQCDDIVVEPRAHRLERGGVGLSVEPKAYAVLVALLQNAGEVVSKDDLLDAAWGHRHVTQGVLTRAVSQLRHVLGDCATHPRYIATVHRLGYRFIGDVRRISAPATLADPTPDPLAVEWPVDAGPETEPMPAAEPPRPTVRPEPPFIRWLAAAITLVVIVAMLAAAGLWHPPHDRASSPRVSPQPALVMMSFAHTGEARMLHSRHWPRNRRVATTYMANHGEAPGQARATGYLVLRPEQALAARE